MTFLALLSLAAWLYLLPARSEFRQAESDDDDLFPAPSEWPEIAAVVPARNEADMLPQSLPSLLRLDYPRLKIVLVDDRSEDDTALIATRIASEQNAADRLTVIESAEIPGWKGKLSAMQCGLKTFAGAPPAYILFTDADIAYEPGALKRLVSRAEAEHPVLCSWMVRLRCESMAERWLIPAFVFFFQMLYPFAWVNEETRKTAAAAGGCMLVRYDTLQAAGGLEPIRTALIDDCALARLLKPHGRIRLGLTQAARSLRPYPRFNDIRRMVARTAYDQLRYSPFYLALATAGMALVFLAPPLLMLFASGPARLFGLLAFALMCASFLPMLRFYGRSPFFSLALPLIALCYMAFTLDSAYQYARGRGGLWKGRAQAEKSA